MALFPAHCYSNIPCINHPHLVYITYSIAEIRSFEEYAFEIARSGPFSQFRSHIVARVHGTLVIHVNLLQAVDGKYAEIDAKLVLECDVKFKQEQITLEIDEDGITVSGWKITPYTKLMVSL